jgi:hypothetical protein
MGDKIYRLTFMDTLTLILVVLKAFGLISWSWWLVLTPLFVSVIIAFIIRLITNR